MRRLMTSITRRLLSLPLQLPPSSTRPLYKLRTTVGGLRPKAGLVIVLTGIALIFLTTFSIHKPGTTINTGIDEHAVSMPYDDVKIAEVKAAMKVGPTYDDGISAVTATADDNDADKDDKHDDGDNDDENKAYDDNDGKKKNEKVGQEGRNRAKAEKVKRDLLVNPLYQARLEKVNNHCIQRPSGIAETIIFDKRKTSSMCVVPKVGCTHWINIFRFINNVTNGVTYATPAEIPRWITHFGQRMPKVTLVSRVTKTDRRNYYKRVSFLSDTFRFMFVRHPIRRLWSAWVDKFFLPDFWFTEGPFVASHLKLETIHHACPTNVTFNQFLRYVTHSHFIRKPQDTNPHWRPLAFLCDSCVFRPHFIGKMETFSEDANLVLSAMNVEPYLAETLRGGAKGKAVYDPRNKTKVKPDVIWNHSPYKQDRAVHEMRMLTEYNLEWLGVKQFRNHMPACNMTALFIAERLWKAFQYNGYIRSDIAFPMTSWDVWEWHPAILRAYIRWPRERAVRQQRQGEQKEQFLKEAFMRIPLTIRLKIRDFYAYDFTQYGYDFDPFTS